MAKNVGGYDSGKEGTMSKILERIPRTNIDIREDFKELRLVSLEI